MKQNPDGSEDIDIETLREIVLAAREVGASVWIHTKEISPSEMSSTDGPEETSMGNHGIEQTYKSKQGE